MNVRILEFKFILELSHFLFDLNIHILARVSGR